MESSEDDLIALKKSLDKCINVFAFRLNNNKDKLEQKGTNSQKKLVPCTAFAKKLLIDELLYARSTLDLYAKKR